MEDARTETEPFGVVGSVEDFTLELGSSVSALVNFLELRTLIRSSIRCRGTAMLGAIDL